MLQFKFNSKYPFDSPQVSYFREHGGIFFKDAVNKQWAKKFYEDYIVVAMPTTKHLCTLI